VTPDSASILVGVVVERRRGTTRWADWAWRAVEVLEAPLPLPPWSLLREAEGRTLFYAGEAEIWLHPSDTPNTRHNLDAATPLVWVVLRPADTPAGMAVQCVTVDGGEAHLYTDAVADVLEALPMPPLLHRAVAAYVAKHHRAQEFHKRRRDAADPEALARRPGGRARPEAAEEEG
jgi:hypothetical protein